MGSTRRVLADRSGAGVKLAPPSYVVLGMLRIGLRSGYAIKRGADRATKHFWPMSLAQVYPELARLEQAGLITGRDDPQGARARRAYEITAPGEQVLLDWLRAPRDAPPQVRDERLLRLFFADALPRADQITLVRRLRESHEEEAAWIQEEIVPIASAAEASGTVFPHALARLSIDVYSTIARSLGSLEKRLSEGSAED
jgi:DNA-binding PadR family transcriptional regulator